jgi:iron complex transport system ATP-binding protein
VTPAAAAVELWDVSVVRDRRQILCEVSWSVEPSQRWVVLGPNGSGKTTLLSVASARLWPSTGRVAVLGERLGRVDVRTLRPRVALVSGAVIRQLRASASAREIVVTGRTGDLEPWWSSYAAEDWAEADRLLAAGGLADGEREFRVISEGERQQVLLARALMGRPELLFFDEPAAGLDLGARERFLSRLGEVAMDDASAPMVLVTHHIEEIPVGITHAALMRDGRMISQGPAGDVVTSEAVSECFGTSVVVRRDEGRWWARTARPRSGTSTEG